MTLTPRVIKPASVRPEINVTPLIDVVLVLLIIFMVVTPLLHDDIAVQVPFVENVQTEAEVPRDQLLVRVTSAGGLLINGEPVPAADYIKTLSARVAMQANWNRVVFVSADAQANYARVVDALDGARRAGAATLGLTTTPADTLEPKLTPVVP